MCGRCVVGVWSEYERARCHACSARLGDPMGTVGYRVNGEQAGAGHSAAARALPAKRVSTEPSCSRAAMDHAAMEVFGDVNMMWPAPRRKGLTSLENEWSIRVCAKGTAEKARFG